MRGKKWTALLLAPLLAGGAFAAVSIGDTPTAEAAPLQANYRTVDTFKPPRIGPGAGIKRIPLRVGNVKWGRTHIKVRGHEPSRSNIQAALSRGKCAAHPGSGTGKKNKNPKIECYLWLTKNKSRFVTVVWTRRVEKANPYGGYQGIISAYETDRNVNETNYARIVEFESKYGRVPLRIGQFRMGPKSGWGDSGIKSKIGKVSARKHLATALKSGRCKKTGSVVHCRKRIGLTTTHVWFDTAVDWRSFDGQMKGITNAYRIRVAGCTCKAFP